MKRSLRMFMLIVFVACITMFGGLSLVLAQEGESGVTTADLQELIEQYEMEGEFTNQASSHALNMHLTAVGHFENIGETDKVIQHVEGFFVLLDHQMEKGHISNKAYYTLKSKGELLINQEPLLTIVDEGVSNAVVVIPEGLASTTIQPWGTWRNYAGATLNTTDHVAHSGNSSLIVEGMRQGGVLQIMDVQPGLISGEAYFYTEAPSEGEIRIGMNLRNENNQNIGSIVSETSQLSDTTGEWSLIRYEGTIPEYIGSWKVDHAVVTLTVENSEDTPVYFDDYLIYQDEAQTNMLQNPSFENVVSNDKASIAFVEYMEKSTGVQLPILTEDPGNEDGLGLNIYIGRSRVEDEARHQAMLSDLNDDGFIIDMQDRHITILGKTPRATEYGVYEFLERYMGIRWLMPGPEGEHVPQHQTLEIPMELILEEPAVISRHFFSHETIDFNKWYDRNRMNHNIQFHHNMDKLFDPVVFADHPEYYAHDEVPTHRYQWQPYFNDETAAAAIQRIIEYFETNPNATSYSLGLNDSTNANFAEQDGHPGAPTERNSVGRWNRSDLYYRWVNQIVEGVTEVYPDKYFGLLAYKEVLDPPKNEDGTPYKLHPNVIPYITVDRMIWEDTVKKQVDQDLVEAWHKSAENLGFYDYFYGAAYSLPRIYFHTMDDVYKYAQEQGVIGHVAELYPNFGGEGPKAWISSKLQWDPDENVDQLLNDWYTSAVGEAAAPYLHQYFANWEQFWADVIPNSNWYQGFVDSNGIYLNFNDLSYLSDITREEMEAQYNLLEQVAAHAKTEPQKARAELFLRAFEYYEASVLSYPVLGEVATPSNEAEALELLAMTIESYEMAEKRRVLPTEYQSNPILRMYGSLRGTLDGIQPSYIAALQAYVETEPEGGIVGEQLHQFLVEIGYIEVSATAVRTTVTKEEIMQSLDFTQGPWLHAGPFDNFYIMNTKNTPPVQTSVYLLWDDENLYVGYENMDDELSNMIVSDEAPNGWWSSGADDSVETFVTDDHSATIRGFFTNPIAVKFARHQRGLESEIEWEANAEIGTDRWNVIQAIPFAEMGEFGIDPNETKTLKALFFRNYQGNSVYIGWDGGAPWIETGFRTLHLVD